MLISQDNNVAQTERQWAVGGGATSFQEQQKKKTQENPANYTQKKCLSKTKDFFSSVQLRKALATYSTEYMLMEATMARSVNEHQNEPVAFPPLHPALR